MRNAGIATICSSCSAVGITRQFNCPVCGYQHCGPPGAPDVVGHVPCTPEEGFYGWDANGSPAE